MGGRDDLRTPLSRNGAAREVIVRSDPGPAGLARNLNDSGKQGFHLDVAWKEGNEYVGMLSRPSGGASTPHTYAVDGDAPNGVHALTRLALGDFPYLSRRLFVRGDAPCDRPERRRRGQRPLRARHDWRSPVAQSRLPDCLRARGPGRSGKVVLSAVMAKRE